MDVMTLRKINAQQGAQQRAHSARYIQHFLVHNQLHLDEPNYPGKYDNA